MGTARKLRGKDGNLRTPTQSIRSLSASRHGASNMLVTTYLLWPSMFSLLLNLQVRYYWPLRTSSAFDINRWGFVRHEMFAN